MSRVGATSAASPRAYAATGRPRLPAFTYDEHSVPTTVSARSRRQTKRAATT